MPYLEPDDTDPLEGFGVSTPATLEDIEEMAYVLAEEYASMGTPFDEIVAMFSSPEHAIPHHAWQVLGRGRIGEIAGECVGLFGRLRFVVTDNPDLDLVQIGGTNRTGVFVGEAERDEVTNG